MLRLARKSPQLGLLTAWLMKLLQITAFGLFVPHVLAVKVAWRPPYLKSTGANTNGIQQEKINYKMRVFT
jgi:hypothetical protein